MKTVYIIFFIIFCSVTLNASTAEAKNAYDNKNYKKAFSLYLNAAKDGDKKAQQEVGTLYLFGLGTNKNENEAFYWLKKANAKYYLREYFSSNFKYNNIALTKYSLKINTLKGARVQILNIKPKYKDNIKLRPGVYKLKVSKEGYGIYKRNIVISEDTILNITLNKLTAKKIAKYNKSKILVNSKIQWSYKNDLDVTYYDSKLWVNPKIELNHSSAIKYCRNLNIKGLHGFVLPDYESMNKYYYNINKTPYYWTSSINSDWGRTYINNHGDDNTAYASRKLEFLCSRFAGYNGSINNLSLLLYKESKKESSKLMLPKKPSIKIKPILVKDEFETTKNFNQRNNELKLKIQKINEQNLINWQKNINRIKTKHKKEMALLNKNKENIYLKSMAQSLKIKYGDPKINSVKYNADKEEFTLRLRSSSFKYKNINKNRLVRKRSTNNRKVTLVKIYDKDESTTVLKFHINKKLAWFDPKSVLYSSYKSPKYIIYKNKIIRKNKFNSLKARDIKAGSTIEFAIDYLDKNKITLNAIFQWTSRVKDISLKKIKIEKEYTFDKVVTIPVSLKYAKKFKAILIKKDFNPTVEFKVVNNKLIFSGIKEIKDPELLVEENEYKKAYDIKNNKNSIYKLQQFITKYPNSTFKSPAEFRISTLREKIKIQKEKERLHREKRRKEDRIREKQRLKEKQRKQDSYYAKKYVGEKVCMDGTTAFILSITITAYVEKVNGNSMQLRISDTEGTSPYVNGVTLYRNTLIWDNYSDWYKCNY